MAALNSIKRLIPCSLSLVFAIIALVFSALTLTSPKWAEQQVHDDLLLPYQWNQSNLVYTTYRSPFSICYPEIQTNNSSASNATQWAVTCHRYRAYGSGNATSCEPEAVTQSDIAGNLGDQRLCQMIHYAGNYSIASTAFAAFSVLLTLVLIAITLFSSRSSLPDQATSNQFTGDVEKKARSRSSPPSWTAYVTMFLLISFFAAFATTLLSQFYGILAFTQDLPGQSDYASSAGSGVFTRTPWYQGIALSAYATCAWAFAAAGGSTAAMTWSLPSLRVW